MEFTFSNLLYFIAYVAPAFLFMSIILLGLLNANTIGCAMYLTTTLIAYGIGYGMQKAINQISPGPKHAVCSVFGDNLFMSPSLSSLLIMSSFGFLLFPFIVGGDMNTYIPLGSFILIMWIIDFYVKMKHSCTNGLGVFFGSFTGLSVGVGISAFCYYVLKKEGLLLRNVATSNKVKCSKPTASKFKCSVYKNGQLVTQSN